MKGNGMHQVVVELLRIDINYFDGQIVKSIQGINVQPSGLALLTRNTHVYGHLIPEKFVSGNSFVTYYMRHVRELYHLAGYISRKDLRKKGKQGRCDKETLYMGWGEYMNM